MMIRNRTTKTVKPSPLNSCSVRRTCGRQKQAKGILKSAPSTGLDMASRGCEDPSGTAEGANICK